MICKKLMPAVLLWMACTLPSLHTQAQHTPLPLDPQVRTGKLSNGLTYYIRKNTTRPNLADFYIAQKVGSIQETPSQRGLAHFLEHMAFNGTTHFPNDDGGKSITGWCETVGIKFGQNLNAYTSVDETVYNISDAPVLREGIVDSCLLILHDWSNDLLLTDKEIDKERGVIHEEWRSRRNAWLRMYERAFPIIYAGTKYTDCMPIGSMDVVDHFKYQELRDYYEKWYRPDLQGVVVVGDIDPDAMEQKIRTLFADIPAQPDAAPRIYYPVNDNKEPIVVIETDKEMTSTEVNLFFKHEAIPDSLKPYTGYYFHLVQNNLINIMLNERLYALQQKPDAPFTSCSAYDGGFIWSKTKGAFCVEASSKEGQIEESLASIYREALRAARYGFTASELERAKSRSLSGYETTYKDRDTRKNRQFVNEYVRLFLDNEPAPGIEYEYELAKKYIPSIPLEDLNRMMKAYITPDNRVLMVMGPEKEGITYPTSQALLKVISSVEDEKIDPYTEKLSDEPLVGKLPVKGKLKEEKKNQALETTVMKLSNGMTVVIKPTDFKADEVNMIIQRPGGNSLYPDSDALNWRYAIGMVNEGGLGSFSKPDLSKKLAGKIAWSSPWMQPSYDGVSGSCAPRDFETMMQLTYLNFTAPRKDLESNQAWRLRVKEDIRNAMAQPGVVFQDSINSTLYGYNERVRRIQEAEIDRINYDRCMEIYRNTFADASDYIVRIVGNVNIDSIRPLIVKYLGALPSTYTKENWKETSLKFPQGIKSNHFNHKQETPSARTLIIYEGDMQYTLRNQLLMSLFSQILSITYTEKVREEEGGTYGVSVSGALKFEPSQKTILQIYYQTAPEKEAKLTPILYNELERFTQEGPEAEKLAKVKEFMLKQHTNNLRENGYWMAKIGDLYFYNMDGHTDYESIIQSITIDELRQFAKQVVTQNRADIVMTDTSGATETAPAANQATSGNN